MTGFFKENGAYTEEAKKVDEEIRRFLAPYFDRCRNGLEARELAAIIIGTAGVLASEAVLMRQMADRKNPALSTWSCQFCGYSEYKHNWMDAIRHKNNHEAQCPSNPNGPGHPLHGHIEGRTDGNS